jgi:hypothetical protein
MSHYTAKQLQDLARRHQVPNRSKYRRKELLQSYLETYWGEEKFRHLLGEMEYLTAKKVASIDEVNPGSEIKNLGNKDRELDDENIASTNENLSSIGKDLSLTGGRDQPAHLPILRVSTRPRLCPSIINHSSLDYLVIGHSCANLFFPLVDDHYVINDLALDCPRGTIWVISGNLEGPTKALGGDNSPFSLRFHLEDESRVGQDNPLPEHNPVVAIELQPLADPAEIGYADLLDVYAEPLADGSCFIENFMEFLKSLARRMRSWHYQPAFVKDITKSLAEIGWNTDELIIMKDVKKDYLPRIRQEWLEMSLKDLKGFGPLYIFPDAQGNIIGYQEGLSG